MVIKLYRCLRNLLTRFAPTRCLIRSLGHYGLLPASVLRRLYLMKPFTFAVRGPGIDFSYAFTPGDEIGQSLFWRGIGADEPETIGPFINWARRITHFIDVGANTGHFSLVALAANPALVAQAFEPVPHIHERLRHNIALNNWQNRCACHETAVSDTHGGKAVLHVPDALLPTSASLNPDGFRGLTGKQIEVDVVRLDHVLEELPGSTLIKIDVEGYEHAVLRGLSGPLTQGWRPAFIIECLPDGPLPALNDFFAAYGYHFHHITPAGLIPHDKIVVPVDTPHRNWLITAGDSALLT